MSRKSGLILARIFPFVGAPFSPQRAYGGGVIRPEIGRIDNP
jgi:hypothetical protein